MFHKTFVIDKASFFPKGNGYQEDVHTSTISNQDL